MSIPHNFPSYRLRHRIRVWRYQHRRHHSWQYSSQRLAQAIAANEAAAAEWSDERQQPESDAAQGERSPGLPRGSRIAGYQGARRRRTAEVIASSSSDPGRQTSGRSTDHPASVGGGPPARGCPRLLGVRFGDTDGARVRQSRTCKIGARPSSRRAGRGFLLSGGLQLRGGSIRVRRGARRDGQPVRVGCGIDPVDRPHAGRHPHRGEGRPLGDRRRRGSLLRRWAPPGWLGGAVPVWRTGSPSERWRGSSRR